MLILARWKDYSNSNMQARLERDTRDRKIRVQLRNEEDLNYNTDGRNPEMAFRDIWETDGT